MTITEAFNNELFLFSSDEGRPIEVLPEMLDYAFVDTCESVNELRAVLKALKSGKWGSYPSLEIHTRKKLMKMLPHKKIEVSTTELAPAIIEVENKRLHDWLECLANDNGAVAKPKQYDTIPVRIVKHTELNVNHLNSATKPNETISKSMCRKFVSKPLSKEYFDRWNKFDASDSSDDEEQGSTIQTSNENMTVNHMRQDKEESFEDSLNKLSQAEKKIMSIRERNKGNEYFKLLENDKALVCYSKSIMLDGSNEKSYANRAAVFIRMCHFDRAVDDCTKALEIDPSYVKARSRRAICFHKIGLFKEAVVDLETCQEMDASANYDRMLQRFKKKLENSAAVEHSTVSASNDVNKDGDIEEIFTPGADASANNCDRMSHGFEEKLVNSVAVEQSTVSSSNEVNKDGDIEEIFTPGAITERQKSPKTNVSPVWRRMAIVETENTGNETEEFSAAKGLGNISVKASSKKHDEYEQNTQRKDSNKLKEKGNNAIAQHRFSDAVQFYTLAIELDPFNYTAFLNRSIAHFKLKEWDKSIEDATACLSGESRNTKALFRRGIARMMQNHDESNIRNALCDFEQSLSIQPPKEQQIELLKKIDECRKLLSFCQDSPSKKESNSLTRSSEGKVKIRQYDSQALAF